MAMHAFPHQELLHAALAALDPSQHTTVTDILPVPALRRDAWHITVHSRDGHRDRQRRLIALSFDRTPDGTDPRALFALAAAAGLPTPRFLSDADDGRSVLVLCAAPAGTALDEALRTSSAAWHISAAAVSLARFLARLHGLKPGDLPLEPASDPCKDQLDRVRQIAAQSPEPLRSTAAHILDWISEQLDPAPDPVPTLGQLRFSSLYLDGGEVTACFGWDRLALRAASNDFVSVVFELHAFPVDVRTQFLAVLQARYLQDGGTSVADAPSRALLAIVERTLFAWSARASRAHSSLEMSDPASVAAALEEAAHAARSGLAALMQL